MKRVYMSCLLAAILTLAVGGTASAQSADEIVEKHLAALGGRDALSKLTSRKLTGTVTVTTPAGDISGPFESYALPPNKSRTYLKLDLSSFGQNDAVVDQRFDGTTGYAINSVQGDGEITGNQLENLRNGRFPNPLLKYKESGMKIEVLPNEKVGEKDAIVLAVTPKTGSAAREFLDASSYLPIKMVMKIDVPQLGGEIEQTTEFSDYREVDGVKVPFQIKVTNPAQTLVIKATRIEHNTVIEDSIFTKPAEKKPD
ncbi:MAG TPA: hypothetical protein VE398_16220 [Acidobacteriota bacterium]|nr:hypothetical protein [Acidobacteriota bacterium]